jgi:uncharacterized protein with HEPN domain
MQPEVRARLEHVITAGEAILRITSGKTFDHYAADEVLRWAVERQFGVIGDALRQVEKMDPGVAHQITGFRRIVDFRNVLVHDYATIYDEAVWRIVERHLPALLSEVRSLTGEAPA